MEKEYIPAEILQDEGIDIKKYLFKILVNWYWFVLSLFAALTLAYFVNKYSEEKYTVTSSIILKDQADVSGVEGILYDIVGRRYRKAVVENEKSILKSYKLARMTLEKLEDFDVTYVGLGRIRERKMYNSAPIKINIDTSVNQPYGYPILFSYIDTVKYRLEIDENYNIDTILRFRQQFKYKGFSFSITLRDSTRYGGYKKYMLYINSLNQLANSYRNRLQIDVNDEKGTVLNLSSTGPVAAQEVDYLNALIDVYLDFGMTEKNKISEKTIKFIDDQLINIKDSLSIADKNLQNFKLRNQIFNISAEGTIIINRLDALVTEKSSLILKNSYYNYINDYLAKKNNITDLVAPSIIGIQDPLLNDLILEISKLQSDKEVLSYNTSGQNPEIERIDIKIENAHKSLVENISSLIKSNNLALADINVKINQVENDIKKLPVNEGKLISFEREFNISNNIYTFLLQKKAEAGITKASNIPDSRILDEASMNNVKQIAPKKKMNYTIGGVIGILLPLLIIILIDYFNNRIIEKKYIEEHTRIPILGSIGHNEKISEIPVFENPKSSLAESFRTFRTNLQYMGIEQKSKIINITSTISGEGKTFCAVNLAAILAMSSKKTLLISLDLRKPKIHQIFNLPNDKGISTLLINQNSFDEIIFPTAIADLFVALSGPIPPNPAELLETQKMLDFIKQAKKQFDFIIIDTPPVAIVTDALLIDHFSDLNIFVVRQNYSHKDILNMVNELYATKKLKNMGLLINDIKVPGYYGYYYGYKYGYGYNYSYSSRYGHYSSDYYHEDEKENNSFKNRLKKILH